MSGPGLHLLAVDDEPAALRDLTRLLRAAPGVDEVDTASDGQAALRQLGQTRFDGVFLDVRMPGLDGLELGRVLRCFAQPPPLVFVSAYDHAAVDAFELEAVDYLRKPVARGRLYEAVERVRRTSAATPAAAAAPASAGSADPVTADDHDLLAVSAAGGATTRLVERSTVELVSSYGDFVHLVTGDERFLVRVTLVEIERRWEPHGFVRTHRQYLANLHHAVELRPQLGGTAELVLRSGNVVPVARRHVGELGRRLRL